MNIKTLLKNVRKFITFKIRLMLMQHKTFVGRYAQNEIELRKFVADREIMVVHLERKGSIGKLDKQLRGTPAAKISKHVLFYVHDNMFSRWIGWRPTREHYVLKGIQIPLLHIEQFTNDLNRHIAKMEIAK